MHLAMLPIVQQIEEWLKLWEIIGEIYKVLIIMGIPNMHLPGKMVLKFGHNLGTVKL